MGVDIHTTVGRINQKRLTQTVEPSTGTALAVFNNRNFQIGDFEFTSDIPEEVDLYRNYSLFSFLAGVRGSVKPIMEQSVLQEATEKFLVWLNDEYRLLKNKDFSDEPDEARRNWLTRYASDVEFDDRYDTGDHSKVFYPIQVLKDFDYNQPALIEDENSEWNNPLFSADAKGLTYRDYVGDQYLKFLDWCVQNNWQFVIFGFDN